MPELRDLADKRGASVLLFNPRTLKIKPGLNIRDMNSADNRAYVEWLANEIATKGFNSILRVFMENGQPVISRGHRRHAAVMLCLERGVDIPLIPCFPEPKGTSEFDIMAGQFTDNEDSRISAIEAGANIKRMLSFGKTEGEVAKAIGRSRSYISQTLEFMGAPSEVHQLVNEGKVSATLAASEVRHHGPEEGKKRLKEGVRKARAAGKSKATARDMPVAAKASPEPSHSRQSPIRDPVKIEQMIESLIELAREEDYDRRLSHILDEAGIKIPAMAA